MYRESLNCCTKMNSTNVVNVTNVKMHSTNVAPSQPKFTVLILMDILICPSKSALWNIWWTYQWHDLNLGHCSLGCPSVRVKQLMSFFSMHADPLYLLASAHRQHGRCCGVLAVAYWFWVVYQGNRGFKWILWQPPLRLPWSLTRSTASRSLHPPSLSFIEREIHFLI